MSRGLRYQQRIGVVTKGEKHVSFPADSYALLGSSLDMLRQVESHLDAEDANYTHDGRRTIIDVFCIIAGLRICPGAPCNGSIGKVQLTA